MFQGTSIIHLTKTKVPLLRTEPIHIYTLLDLTKLFACFDDVHLLLHPLVPKPSLSSLPDHTCLGDMIS